PETHQRPPSPGGRTLASYVRRQRRDQIAIAPASPSAPHLPRVPSLEAFGRRPRCKPNRRDGPSSETLHRRRLIHRSKQDRYSITSSARASSVGGTSRTSAF